MNIDLSLIDREQFTLKEGVFCGIPAVLVTPAMQGTQWTQLNKHLRSSIWALDGGRLLSGGFFKFTNAGENPEHFPMPTSLDHADVVEKLDGSCAIFDLVNTVFSCRTRGTLSYETLDNASDFAYAISKYPGVKTLCEHVPEVSWLFEITTPNQRIVIDYGPEIELTLIGGIRKVDYSMPGQDVLDSLARAYGLRRPRYFPFSSLDHLLADVKTWEGLEGCVIYDRATGSMHKAKADAYLRMHRFKERVTLPNLIDLFFAYGRPTLDQFTARLEQDFDHECMLLGRELATTICETYTHVCVDIARIGEEVNSLRALSRKDAALAIQTIFDQIDRGVAFKCLDNRPIDDKMIRRLMEYTLDNEG